MLLDRTDMTHDSRVLLIPYFRDLFITRCVTSFAELHSTFSKHILQSFVEEMLLLA
jgi:hypothetical protein